MQTKQPDGAPGSGPLGPPSSVPLEFWRFGIGLPGDIVAQARRAERLGWDGMLLVDSQGLAGDCYVELTQIAMTTERLRVGTGVTNPRTRHPAVTASVAATIHARSNGRFVLGLGRGDSSLANLGLAPSPVADFARYVTQVRAYLNGEEIPFEETRKPGERTIEALRLANGPKGSKLRWLSHLDLAPPPVEVFGSGPKVLQLAGAHADRVMIAVGGDPDRVAWAVEQLRKGCADAGRAIPPRIGCYVNVVCHPDPKTAYLLARGRIASHARWSAMYGSTAGPVAAADAASMEDIRSNYDMEKHSHGLASHSEAMSYDFATRFAVLGPPSHCINRLQQLRDLGVDHFAIGCPSAGADRRMAVRCVVRFCLEVMPALR